MSFSDTPMPGSSADPNNTPKELSAYDPGVFMNLLQHQVIQHWDLMTVIQVQQQEQQALMETFQIHLQNSAAASMTAPTPVIIYTSNPMVKFHDPTSFSRKHTSLSTYISSIHTYITLSPLHFH